jgi:hypothetical protein
MCILPADVTRFVVSLGATVNAPQITLKLRSNNYRIWVTTATQIWMIWVTIWVRFGPTVNVPIAKTRTVYQNSKCAFTLCARHLHLLFWRQLEQCCSRFCYEKLAKVSRDMAFVSVRIQKKF